MTKDLKVIILAKSVDGGTGTFIKSLLKMSNTFNKQPSIKVLVLERPQHRHINKIFGKLHFFKTKGKYPQSYILSASNILSFLKESHWASKQINLYKPDVLLGVGVHANLLLMINKTLLRKNIPAILSTHIELNKTLLEKSSPILNLLLKKTIYFLYNRAEINVCVSKKAALSLKNNFGLIKMPKVIYNGIKIPSNPKIVPLDTKSPVYITVTRLTAQKAVGNLIHAFKALSIKVPRSKLLIVGNGPTKARLVQLTKRLQLNKKITFTGWVNNINLYLKKSNIFVLSSKREGLPYVLLEAMSQGKPAISTNAPHGPSEILDNGKYGILVPVNDIKALEKAMIKLGTNKNLYKKFARLSLKKSEAFSENVMLEEYKKVILYLQKTV